MWAFLMLILLIASWYLLTKPLFHWKNLGVTQTKSPWIILGDNWRYISPLRGQSTFFDFVKWMTEGCKATGYMGIYDFTVPVLCITDPELIKTITVKHFEYFTDILPLSIDPKLESMAAGTLLLQNGEKWKSMRTLLSPILTTKKMKFLWNFIAEETTKLVDFLSEKTSENGCIEVEMADLFLGISRPIQLELKHSTRKLFFRFSSDVAANLAIGIKTDSLRGENNILYKSALELSEIDLDGPAFLMHRFFPRLSKVLPFLATIRNNTLFVAYLQLLGIRIFNKKSNLVFEEAYKESISAKLRSQVKRNDVVDSLLDIINSDNGDQSSLKLKSTFWDVVGMAANFFSAGLHPVSSALLFGTYELALNKDVQERLRLEIHQIAQKHPEVTYEVIQEMLYMDMVVSEILRKWPPVVITSRVVVKPYNLKLGTNSVKLNKKEKILIPIFGLHHMAEYYPNPEKFDPERFSSENKNKINPYAYIPFGTGPRFCIGSRFGLMKIKLVLFHLLKNFELIPSNKTLKPLKISAASTKFQMQEGCWIGMKRIEIAHVFTPKMI
ncbi:LOW QUALITY PROTEIN: cytochrome P450 9e2-like [Euwallacea similis]|uniref:LOW QUALITY PROTEIN: cytochrome P450 9e2-like n=1 Tax=Euwallacea similis TaxID=1736056 RepID=UPI00344EF9EF